MCRGRNPSGFIENMGHGSIRVPKGKVFYREWLNCGVERAFLEGERRQAAVQSSEEGLRTAPRIMTTIKKTKFIPWLHPIQNASTAPSIRVKDWIAHFC